MRESADKEGGLYKKEEIAASHRGEGWVGTVLMRWEGQQMSKLN